MTKDHETRPSSKPAVTVLSRSRVLDRTHGASPGLQMTPMRIQHVELLLLLLGCCCCCHSKAMASVHVPLDDH